MSTHAPAPICARCNRPYGEHVAVPYDRSFVAGMAFICPTALYHPLSVEAPPKAEGWTERAAEAKETT